MCQQIRQLGEMGYYLETQIPKLTQEGNRKLEYTYNMKFDWNLKNFPLVKAQTQMPNKLY